MITFNPYLWIGVWFLPILYTSIQVQQQVFLIKIFEDLIERLKLNPVLGNNHSIFERKKKVPFKQTLNRKTYMEVKYVYLHRTCRVKLFAFVDLKNYLSKPNHSTPSPGVKWLVSQPELFRNNDLTTQANCQWLPRENDGIEGELPV